MGTCLEVEAQTSPAYHTAFFTVMQWTGQTSRLKLPPFCSAAHITAPSAAAAASLPDHIQQVTGLLYHVASKASCLIADFSSHPLHLTVCVSQTTQSWDT